MQRKPPTQKLGNRQAGESQYQIQSKQVNMPSTPSSLSGDGQARQKLKSRPTQPNQPHSRPTHTPASRPARRRPRCNTHELERVLQEWRMARGKHGKLPTNHSVTEEIGRCPRNITALQDYQMQLLLLEQQNRKRLMMARRESSAAAQKSKRTSKL